MASIGKCMGIMTGAGLLCGAASTYYMQSKANKAIMASAQAHAQNGEIPIGGRTPDGKMWDGKMKIDEFKKKLEKRAMITSGIMGGVSAVGTALIAGLTLLLRGRIK